MEYLPGMEIIKSDVCETVISQMKSYDYTKYTEKDVMTALEHETCSGKTLRHCFLRRQNHF